jgi:hypothetical protein
MLRDDPSSRRCWFSRDTANAIVRLHELKLIDADDVPTEAGLDVLKGPCDGVGDR